MKFWMRSAALGTPVLVLAGLLICRLATRLGGSQARKPEPAVWTVLRADPDDEAIQARIEAKLRIADDLIEGRLSLLQAAAAFRDLNAQAPPCDVKIVFADASSLDEADCRSVIDYVDAIAPRDQVKRLTSGLKAEVEARLRDGTLRLPEP